MGARKGFAADLAAANRAALSSPSFEEGEALRKSRLEPEAGEAANMFEEHVPPTYLNNMLGEHVGAPLAPTIRTIVPPRNPVQGPAEIKFRDHCVMVGAHTATYSSLEAMTRIPRETLRGVIRKFKALGLLRVEPQGIGRNATTLYEWLGDKHFPPTSSANTLEKHVGQHVPSTPLLNREIPRQNLSISLSEETRRDPDAIRLLALTREDVNENWPCLLGMLGFGPPQIAECVENLLKIGKPLDRFTKSMDHGEWELANTGKLLAAKGENPGRGPANYFYGSMKKSGYFRAPEGYVSPEQQALLDEQAEAKKLAAIAASMPKPPKEPTPWELKTQEDIPMAVAWGEALPEVEVQRLFRTPRLPKDKVQLVTVWRQEGFPEPQLPPEEEI